MTQVSIYLDDDWESVGDSIAFSNGSQNADAICNQFHREVDFANEFELSSGFIIDHMKHHQWLLILVITCDIKDVRRVM